MSINKQPGFKAKLRVGQSLTAFGVQRINYRRECPAIDVTNTEAEPGCEEFAGSGEEGGAAEIGDVKRGTLSLTLNYDDVRDPFAAPLSLIVDQYYAIKYYPSGVTGPLLYDLLNCRLRNASHDALVPGGQPVTLEFGTDGLADSLEPIANPDAD